MDLPQLGLGTYGLNVDEAYNIILKGLYNGYTAIDTAPLYGNEISVGRAIQTIQTIQPTLQRSNIFVTTKISSFDLKNSTIGKSIRRSFRQLNVDYIDLVLLHNPLNHIKNWKKLEELYMSEFKDKIRFIGVSNFNTKHISDILETCKVVPYVNQIENSPFFIRRDIITLCQHNNIKICSYSPLLKGTKFDHPTIQKLSIKYNTHPANILLSWQKMRNYPCVFTATADEHINNTNEILLDMEDMKDLNELDSNYSVYPHLSLSS